MSAQTERVSVHPLFIRSSLYRLIAEESTFLDDNGEASIRAYFDSRRRAMRDKKAIIPFSSAICGSKTTPSDTNDELSTAAGVVGQVPSLILFRFDEGESKPQILDQAAPDAPFPGYGLEDASSLRTFRFDIDVPCDHTSEGRMALALIITPETLARLVEIETEERDGSPHALPNEEESPVKTLAHALSAETLSNQVTGSQALRISTQLALCPAFQSVIRDSRFMGEMDLDDLSPPLPRGTIVVLCIGPRATLREGDVNL